MSNKKNKNFKNINYDINHNIKTITEYRKKQQDIKTLIDPETHEELEYRKNFDYQIGDYAWYIPEAINEIQPFLLIRCIIVDVCNIEKGAAEYILDEPVKRSVTAAELYPDVSYGFAELRRIFYYEIAKYSMKELQSYVLNNDELDTITYETYEYMYNDLTSWRYSANNNKELDDNILTVKKEKLTDWYNANDFFEFNLMYHDT